MKTALFIASSTLLIATALAEEQPPTDKANAPSSFLPGDGPKRGLRRHITRPSESLPISSVHNPAQSEAPEEPTAMPPTRSSFFARWEKVDHATGYRLDVSTNSAFTDFINGYHDLDVGNADKVAVTGLKPGTQYFYRVRAYNDHATSGSSEAMAAATAGGSGLIINATFDSSITTNPNAAAIEAMINQAVSTYESLFSDPITVSILFRYTTTSPGGSALGMNSLAESEFGIYTFSWSTFINALRADAKTSNDTSANASLPTNSLSNSIEPSSANGRAIGLNTPPQMFANGNTGSGGQYDGIVTLNSSVRFQFTRPPNSSSFDALTTTEHEMDEVLGLGSFINSGDPNLDPQDLFSWSAPGARNTTSSGARYFSINSGNTNIVNFNQDPGGDFGDWLSDQCPQANPYVQNAFGCTGQYDDVTATSPEGINLDVIGYDLGNLPAEPLSSDIVWQNSSTGQRTIWLMDGTSWTGREAPLQSVPVSWQIAALGDFNKDGKADIVWQNTSTGQRTIWLMNGTSWSGNEAALPTVLTDWQIATTGDFNGDGNVDIVWQNTSTGQRTIWLMNGTTWTGNEAPLPTIPVQWQIVGAADFNGDGNVDIVWQNTSTGQRTIWLMNGTTWTGNEAPLPSIPTQWQIAGTGDFNGDGKPDILWQNSQTGQRTIWLMNGTQWGGDEAAQKTVPLQWQISNH